MANTFGEKRIRVDFNPMKSDSIMIVKKEFAQLIDQLEVFKRDNSDPETMRLVATAQTKIEEAAMWTVKALTK
jgi:hypothetical protein